MTLKKLTFCILCFANAVNLATEEDLNDENFSNSKVEENILINKNNWNTRKWGSIYFLFAPWWTIMGLFPPFKKYIYLRLLSFFSTNIQYKYIAKKGVGILLNLGLGPRYVHFILNEKKSDIAFFSFMVSICWVYKKKGKKIFSGSFCPLGFGYKNLFSSSQGLYNKDNGNFFFLLNLTFLNYENGKGFYLSWAHFDIDYETRGFLFAFLTTPFRLELGFDFTKITDRKGKEC